MLEHLAALIGESAPRTLPIAADGIRGKTEIAHVVVHRTQDGCDVEDSRPLESAALRKNSTLRVDVACGAARLVQRGGAIARVTMREQITTTGFELTDPWASMVLNRSNASAAMVTSR
jgi:hypothetical protein